MTKPFINLEQPPQVDRGIEKSTEMKVEAAPEGVSENISEVNPSSVSIPAIQTKYLTPVNNAIKDPQVQKIEDILAEGLGDYYTKLAPKDKELFKQSGEQAAKEVNTILQKAIIKIEEIVDIIKRWLGTIPGLNKFFIEQSAKIKADKVYIISKKS